MLEDMEEIALTYTEDLVKKAVKALWWRAIGLSHIVIMVLTFIGTAFLYSQGVRSWFVGVLGTCVLLGVLAPIVLYVNYYRSALGKFRALKGGKATLRIDPECIEMESNIGKSSLKWAVIDEVWRLDAFWLVFLSKGQSFFTLPLASLPEEAQKAIIEYVEAAGGKIS